MASDRGAGDQPHAVHSEVSLAVVNALKMALSILATSVVSIGLNLWLPRFIGVSAFGQLNFADALATSFFAFSTFGIETYIRKEVSARPEHANDFYGGFLLLRLAVSAVLFGLLALYLTALKQSGGIWTLSFIYAGAQVCILMNFSEIALLQASGHISEVAWLNVLGKLLWAFGVFVSLYFRQAGIEWVAIWLLLSEALKAVLLTFVAHRRLGLTFKVDFLATWSVVIASMPFFLNNIAHRMYEKINATILGTMTTELEVGYYAGAARLASMVLLFLPVVQGVIVPMAARLAVKSQAAMDEIMRAAQRLVMIGGTFLSLMIFLHSDWVVTVVLGPDFARSALVLKFLAPMLTITFMAVIGAIHLIQSNKVWVMTKISTASLLLNPLLNVPLILYGQRLGAAWPGAMSALCSLLTEAANVVVIFSILGRRAVDKASLKLVGKLAVISLLLYGGNRLGNALLIFPESLLAEFFWMVPETLLYVLLLWSLGVFSLSDLKKQWRKRRQQPQGVRE